MASGADTHTHTHTYRRANQSNFKKPGARGLRPLAPGLTIKLILQTLQVNTALRKIAVSNSAVYTEEIKKEFSPLVQGVNNSRESYNCQVKLQEILFW